MQRPAVWKWLLTTAIVLTASACIFGGDDGTADAETTDATDGTAADTAPDGTATDLADGGSADVPPDCDEEDCTDRSCSDGADNDDDGVTDCKDADCSRKPCTVNGNSGNCCHDPQLGSSRCVEMIRPRLGCSE